MSEDDCVKKLCDEQKSFLEEISHGACLSKAHGEGVIAACSWLIFLSEKISRLEKAVEELYFARKVNKWDHEQS